MNKRDEKELARHGLRSALHTRVRRWGFALNGRICPAGFASAEFARFVRELPSSTITFELPAGGEGAWPR